jgi:extracellular elastinolytic metalloproteinase
MPERHEPATRRRLRTIRRTTGATLAAALVVGLAQLPSTSFAAPEPATEDFVGWGDSPAGLSDLDARGVARPTALQRRAATALDASVRWNDFGTPASIFAAEGSLAKAT